MSSANKLYVPDPSVWVTYFRRKKRVQQHGGGASMMPIVEEQRYLPSTEGAVHVDLVSPVEAATERVQSTIKRIKRHKRQNAFSAKTGAARARSKKPRNKIKTVRLGAKKPRKSSKKNRVKVGNRNKKVPSRDIFS